MFRRNTLTPGKGRNSLDMFSVNDFMTWIDGMKKTSDENGCSPFTLKPIKSTSDKKRRRHSRMSIVNVWNQSPTSYRDQLLHFNHESDVSIADTSEVAGEETFGQIERFEYLLSSDGDGDGDVEIENPEVDDYQVSEHDFGLEDDFNGDGCQQVIEIESDEAISEEEEDLSNENKSESQLGESFSFNQDNTFGNSASPASITEEFVEPKDSQFNHDVNLMQGSAPGYSTVEPEDNFASEIQTNAPEVHLNYENSDYTEDHIDLLDHHFCDLSEISKFNHQHSGKPDHPSLVSNASLAPFIVEGNGIKNGLLHYNMETAETDESYTDLDDTFARLKNLSQRHTNHSTDHHDDTVDSHLLHSFVSAENANEPTNDVDENSLQEQVADASQFVSFLETTKTVATSNLRSTKRKLSEILENGQSGDCSLTDTNVDFDISEKQASGNSRSMIPLRKKR